MKSKYIHIFFLLVITAIFTMKNVFGQNFRAGNYGQNKINRVQFRSQSTKTNLIPNNRLFKQNQNIKLIANINDYPETGYSDVWGYTAPNGDEYALLGVNNGISIISVYDTSNISEVNFVPWEDFPPLGWYDIKTYKNYMYVSTEATQQVLIVDLSTLPDSSTIAGSFVGAPSGIHNIYIDTTAALLYVIDAGNYSPSVLIFSLADPLNPVQVSDISGNFDSHDAFAQDSILYVSEGVDPSIGFYDVSDPSNPSLLRRMVIPNGGYSHQVWVTPDNNYMVTTEENYQKSVKVWDIKDLDNIELVNEYSGGNELAHNAYFHDGKIYIAHYESGLKVLDFSNPETLPEIGFYDTYPDGEGHEFNGAWGVYPFTQSGLIYVSDRSTGLYVFKFVQETGPQIVANDLDFGNVLLREISDTLTITLHNLGTEDLIITSVSQPDEPFTIHNISELPIAINPFESISFDVLFYPEEEGYYDTDISINSNDLNESEYNINLTGRGFILTPAQEGLIYASTGRQGENSGSLLSIDPITGAGTLIGPILIDNAPGFAINSKGEIYCTSSFPADLYKIDSKTGSAVFAISTELQFLDAIAFDSQDNLYALGGDPPIATLYKINVLTGEIITIGSTGELLRGMTFDPFTGALWASTGASSDEIYTIDINTAKATFVGKTGIGGSTPDILFDKKGNLYGSKGGGQKINNLISISKRDGSGSVIGSIGYRAVSGLAALIDTFWNVIPQNLTINKTTLIPGTDTLKIKTNIFNPTGYTLTVQAILESPDLSISDTLLLMDDGSINDSTFSDIYEGNWLVKPGKAYYNISINAFPANAGLMNNVLYNITSFTTRGPVSFDHFSITSADTLVNPSDNLRFDINVKNTGVDTVFNVTSHTTSLDTCANVIAFSDPKYGDIAPGSIAEPSRNITINFDETCPAPASIAFAVDLFSEGILFWSDTFYVEVAIVNSIQETKSKIPKEFALDANFPNPFNPTTTISYQLPKTSTVDLSIYNLLGQKIHTLLAQQQQAGKYNVTWNASGFASGVYLYRLETDKGFIQTRKLILLK